MCFPESITVSSTIVFHSPHASHRPAHRAEVAPHDWQTNAVRVFIRFVASSRGAAYQIANSEMARSPAPSKTFRKRSQKRLPTAAHVQCRHFSSWKFHGELLRVSNGLRVAQPLKYRSWVSSRTSAPRPQSLGAPWYAADLETVVWISLRRRWLDFSSPDGYPHLNQPEARRGPVQVRLYDLEAENRARFRRLPKLARGDLGAGAAVCCPSSRTCGEPRTGQEITVEASGPAAANRAPAMPTIGVLDRRASSNLEGGPRCERKKLSPGQPCSRLPLLLRRPRPRPEKAGCQCSTGRI